ncbi:hypothetical protein [Pedobacter sp. UYP1]|uniref:hypothetical protein n=1 Tax=Pedobacter sp. UYP1 TaxID=1756396 RepID=UPI0033963380
MVHLPIYIKLIFILSTIFSVLMLYKASNYSKSIILILLCWLALQAIISLSGFYTVTSTNPPRFALLIFPPVILIAVSFFTRKVRNMLNGFSLKTLTLLHLVRIPVEIGLYCLCLHRVVPEIMTFEGRNFDILCGLTAPIVYYFGYIKKVLNSKVLIAWNILCLLSLANIVTTAVLSSPFPIQQFAFNQPNLALLYFPFVWLPCCIVPSVLLAHLITIKRLINSSIQL